MQLDMSTRWDDHPLAAIARYFQGRFGIDMDGSPGAHAARAIEGAMRAAGQDDPALYLALVQRDQAALDGLIDALCVGESYFFRDAGQLAFLAREILPGVQQRRREGGPGLRAWSAGCASGEEPSSLAILLDERGALDGTLLLATDVSRAALTAARRALYRPWSLRGSDAHRARPYLDEGPEGLELSPRIREAVTYRRLDLASDEYAAIGAVDLDVVLCRNVLIYFDAETIARVAMRLARTLREDGWLITGPSDPPLGDVTELEAVVHPEGVFHRKRRRVAAPSVRPRARPPSRPVRTEPPRASEPTRPPAPSSSALTELRELSARDPAAALAATSELLVERPLDADVHYLRATLMLALDRADEAERALAELLTLDPRCAVALFLIADLQLRRGDVRAARRSLRAAVDEAGALAPDAPLPRGDGEPAGRLRAAAETRLRAVESGRRA